MIYEQIEKDKKEFYQKLKEARLERERKRNTNTSWFLMGLTFGLLILYVFFW